jgi:hypothetical protein
VVGVRYESERLDFTMATDVKQLKAELTAAGIEIYRTKKTEIHIAERVRLHIMDSGVRLQLLDTGAGEDSPASSPSGERLRVVFTARSQRSDFPDAGDAALFAKVRAAVGPGASARGFAETAAGTLEVKDPMDAARVLDVWHEVTYQKDAEDSNAALDEIRWALGVERCIQR